MITWIIAGNLKTQTFAPQQRITIQFTAQAPAATGGTKPPILSLGRLTLST